MLFTPSLLETVLDTQSEEVLRKSFAFFRLIHLCGEVVTTQLVRRLMRILPHIQYTNLYSISETHDVAVANLNEFHARNEQRQFAPVGRLIDQVRVLILDSTLKAVPMGVSGEVSDLSFSFNCLHLARQSQIYVAGPTLALGYINRPELNRSRFLEVPKEYQSEMGLRMYKTGDWGKTHTAHTNCTLHCICKMEFRLSFARFNTGNMRKVRYHGADTRLQC